MRRMRTVRASGCTMSYAAEAQHAVIISISNSTSISQHGLLSAPTSLHSDSCRLTRSAVAE